MYRLQAGAVAVLLLGLVVQFLGRLVYPSTSLKERFLGAWKDARSALNESQRWPLEVQKRWKHTYTHARTSTRLF